MSGQSTKYQNARSPVDATGLTLLFTITPLALYFDLIIFRNNVGELSVTEIIQELFIFDCAVMFLLLARKKASSRGFYLLVAGFFTCLLIRELDQLFDLVWHGFWVIPALLVAFSTTSYALLRHTQTVWQPMKNFIQSQQFCPLIVGLSVVMVISRVLGSGHLIWIPLLGHSTGFLVKTVIQEGLELVGYTIIVRSCYCHYQSINAQSVYCPPVSQSTE